MSVDLATAKLVLAGPVGAGKTTAIGSLADSAPVSTEMPMLDGPMGDKTTTTVAFDFSTVMLDDGTPLFIYGLPGQDHFGHMRSIVLEGAIGAIIVLDGHDSAINQYCKEWLHSIRSIAPDIPIVIGITKTDITPDFSIVSIRKLLAGMPPPVPIFTFDAREREQVSHLVRALLMAAE